MSLKSIEGARKRKRSREAKLEQRIEGLEKLISKVIEDYENRFARANARIVELTRANNASSLLVSTIEQFLDDRFPEWDEGKREVIREKSELLRRRLEIAGRLAKGVDLEADDRVELAEELFTLSRRLGSESNDVPIVVGALMKARDVKRASEIIRFVRTSKIAIAEEVAELFAEIESKVASVVEADPV